MGFLKGFSFFLSFTSIVCSASVAVAFFEKFDSKGNRIELEKGGRFFHIAILHDKRWLHADSYYGVRFEDHLPIEKYGSVTTLLYAKDLTLSESSLQEFLGKPYDSSYTWGDEKIYCSELIAKLLHIPAVPMRFDGEYWKGRESLPWGELGASPDYVFQYLSSSSAWRERRFCQALLK